MNPPTAKEIEMPARTSVARGKTVRLVKLTPTFMMLALALTAIGAPPVAAEPQCGWEEAGICVQAYDDEKMYLVCTSTISWYCAASVPWPPSSAAADDTESPSVASFRCVGYMMEDSQGDVTCIGVCMGATPPDVTCLGVKI